MKIRPLLVYPLALATHTFALSWPLSLSFPVFGSRPRSSSTRAQYHQPQESWLESLKVGDGELGASLLILAWIAYLHVPVPGLSRSEMDSLFMNTRMYATPSFTSCPQCKGFFTLLHVYLLFHPHHN